MKKVLKVLLWILSIFVVAVIAFFGFYTAVDFKPDKVIELKVTSNEKSIDKEELTLMTWNLGYMGMGKEIDFFMDGGTQSNPKKGNVERNLKGILNFISTHNVDFYLFQEVDKDSKRSYHIDESSEIAKTLNDYSYSFATNYKNPYVPVPLSDPMGKVFSGLFTLGKYTPSSATRYSLPGEYGWPVKLVQLDRCIQEWRLPYKGKELIIINTHNSAFDDGSLRKTQMEFLKEKLLNEYKNGNYVIIGGDWNMVPPGVSLNNFKSEQKIPSWVIEITKEWPDKGWKWNYDLNNPSIRTADIPYTPGKNYTTIIDSFLTSPNIEVESIKGYNLNFVYSDHNPVMIKVKLN